MWNITNDVVNQECNSNNSHLNSHWKFINCIQLAFNREREYNLSFIKTVKRKFFPFVFFLKILTNISLFQHIFCIFPTKKIGTKSGIQQISPFCWKIFTNFLISQIFQREKPSLHHYLLLLTHSNQFHIIIFKLEESLCFG